MNRRNLMLGAVGTVALPLPEVAAQPARGSDADLIRTCAEHNINLAAYNRDGGMLPMDTPDPLWAAYERTRDAITAAKPLTIDGMLAKACAAKAEAMGLDDEEDPDNTPAATWAWDLVNDLLAGRAGA